MKCLSELWHEAAKEMETSELDPATMAQVIDFQCFCVEGSRRTEGGRVVESRTEDDHPAGRIVDGRQVRTHDRDVIEIPIEYALQLVEHLRTSWRPHRGQTLRARRLFKQYEAKMKRRKEELRRGGLSAVQAGLEAAEWAAKASRANSKGLRWKPGTLARGKRGPKQRRKQRS